MAGSEDNFSFIEFPNDFTDGDQSKWPAAPYVKVLEGSPSDRLWRHKTGQALAATVGYAGVYQLLRCRLPNTKHSLVLQTAITIA